MLEYHCRRGTLQSSVQLIAHVEAKCVDMWYIDVYDVNVAIISSGNWFSCFPSLYIICISTSISQNDLPTHR